MLLSLKTALKNLFQSRSNAAQTGVARSARCSSVLFVLSGVLGLVPHALSATAEEAVDDKARLYEVSVDVASRSLADRRVAAATGLDILLTRLSGLTALPDSSALTRARRAPDRYYSQFRYVTTERYDDLGQTITELRLKYSPPAVRRLMTSAELPLWTLNRPRVAVWLAERNSGGTDLIDDPSHPLLAAVLGRASYRGLPAVIPGYAGVSASAVWERDQGALQSASDRVDAQLLLVGRAEQLGPESWRVRWTSWSDSQRRNLNLSGGLASVSEAAIDMVVDPQVRQFTAAGGAGSTLELVIGNIGAVDDYAQVLKYLGSLGYIETVDVRSLRDDELTLVINTASDMEKLGQLLAVDGRLTPSTRAPSPPRPNPSPRPFDLPAQTTRPVIVPVPTIAENLLRVDWQG